MYRTWLKSIIDPSWEQTDAEYRPIIHGDGTAPELKDCPYAWMDLRGETDGRMGHMRLKQIEIAIKEGFEFVGHTDDDARFTNPVFSMGQVMNIFEANPHVGACGPMYGLRLYFGYLAKRRDQKRPVYGSISRMPWATFGCQIYRVEALQKFDWRRVCMMTKFRTDVQSYMALFTQKYLAMEFETAFVHKCSNGLFQKTQDADFLRKKWAIVESDFSASSEYFKEWPELVRDLKKVRQQEQRRIRKELTLLGATL